MWTIFKYIINNPDDQNKDTPNPVNEIPEDIGFENSLETIKNEIDKDAENYIISLHYLEFPIVIHYGIIKLKETKHLNIIDEYVETYKEARKILLMGKEDDIKDYIRELQEDGKIIIEVD